MQDLDNTPLLVGIGTVEQRFEDPALAREPIDLMLEAVRRAASDSRRPEVLSLVGLVAVPKGRWRYEDPGRHLARSIQADGAETVLGLVGVLQQSLIGEACQRIAEGRAEATVVVGGEARYRRLRGLVMGVPTPESPAAGTPDAVLRAEAELVLPAEVEAGLGGMPVGYYAIIESALTHRRGVTVEQQRREVARLYSRFSEIAAENPHAWRREPVSPEEVYGPTLHNPMLAFPYTKLHNTTWNVDQAAALLFCSKRVAEDLGIPPSQWIYPLTSTESNHVTALSERRDLSTSVGARVAGRRALEAGGITTDQLDLVDLYSCFPSAVQIYAEELGVDDRLDWTVTGGMPFAGGPFNSYVLQSTCRMVELLRRGGSSTGLVTSVSGVLTKQGFGLWSNRPGPRPFTWLDATPEVAQLVETVPVEPMGNAVGAIAGYTVVHRDGDHVAVALLDTDRGTRTLASTRDAGAIELLESQDCCGRPAASTRGALAITI
jgi:acetyl-CoA C-acetyltransferase